MKKFGAVGDGRADDTDAFVKAIEATKGVIHIPAGRYKITRVLRIDKPYRILRGEGPGKTVLFCPKPLNQIKPNWGKTTSGRKTSNYSWSGGIVRISGSTRSKTVGAVTREAKRGDRILAVSETRRLRPGQRIRISVRDAEGQKSLLKHLYSGDPGDHRKVSGGRASMVVRIRKISGRRLMIDRPLRFDLRSAWSPKLETFEPTVHEVGIENLAFEFPNTPYGGHFTEKGFNALYFGSVSDCWARNVTIRNADSGIFCRGWFCTLEGIVFESDRKTSRGDVGHHGVTLGHDILLRDFDFRCSFIHDITVSYFASGNVAAGGKAVNLSLDHHKKAPFENLFTDIDAGKGTQLWRSGGGRSLGKHCGARGTFWNIRAEKPIGYPHGRFGPASMNIVAVQPKGKSITETDGRWYEAIDPKKIEPKNLYEAQRRKRLGR